MYVNVELTPEQIEKGAEVQAAALNEAASKHLVAPSQYMEMAAEIMLWRDYYLTCRCHPPFITLH